MGTRQFDADIAIIGGGPAGSAAAITCSTRGLSVIVLEREEIFGERPGETMHPGVRPILEQLGLSGRIDTLATGLHSGIWIEWGGPARFQAFGSDESGAWLGFHLWRPDFDTALLSLAQDSGADVRRGTSVTGIIEEHGSNWEINTNSGPVSARIVIDASGRSRYLARQLQIVDQIRSPKLIARYGYMSGSCPLRDEAPKITGDLSGWTWTARIREGLYQWTCVDFSGLAKDDWCPPEFHGMTPVSRTRGADVTWRIAKTLAGNNWFMAGDAAVILDPTSSRGVLKSIMTGMMAGHLAEASIRGKLTSSHVSSYYDHWLRDWFEKDVEQMAQFYQLLNSVHQDAHFARSVGVPLTE